MEVPTRAATSLTVLPPRSSRTASGCMEMNSELSSCCCSGIMRRPLSYPSLHHKAHGWASGEGTDVTVPLRSRGGGSGRKILLAPGAPVDYGQNDYFRRPHGQTQEDLDRRGEGPLRGVR